jgi:hypothetical protein
VPHAVPAQPLPETIQLMPRSGFPAELTTAANARADPISTGVVCGDTTTATSLVIVTLTEKLFELSATLVACTAITFGTGILRGDVYEPVAVIVPIVELPPGIPFTLQFTFVFVELLTTAANACN